jgi:hypothetical protein
MIAIAFAIACARVAFRLLGIDEHAAVVSGMPLGAASWVLGPIAVLLSLAATIVLPALVLGAALGSLQFVRARKSTGKPS